MPSSIGFNIEQRMLLQKERRRSIQLHMILLSHASKCKDDACPSSNCVKMKALLRHTEECKVTCDGGCPLCKRAWALLHVHARQCKGCEDCQVPHCAEIGQRYHQLAPPSCEPAVPKARVVSFEVDSNEQ